MNESAIFEFLRNVGCCDACCIRYLGFKNPNAYENTKTFITRFTNKENDHATSSNTDETEVPKNVHTSNGDSEQPPMKKQKLSVCVSCIGVLQEETWDESIVKVKEVLDKKRYECATFACALSAPIATLLREKILLLMLKDAFPDYGKDKPLTPLKEAWKWSFGPRLSLAIRMTLDSGAVSPLLVTLGMEYVRDMEELELLKAMCPSLFEERSKQKKRYCTEFTRRSVELAMESLSLEALKDKWVLPPPPPDAASRCVSVAAARAPIYFAGRYIKLSRNLPQTPWMVGGKRMMESSVQEILFAPIQKLYNICQSEAEHRLKMMSAGREDVDVRCLGSGRPFAIELMDPRYEPTPHQLQVLCQEASAGGLMVVSHMQLINKEDLTYLKQGEQNKCKIYEALCIKLSRTPQDPPEQPIAVTEADINSINKYTNVDEGDCRVLIQQKTPIRVLHRRPLLIRPRKILDLEAALVPGHPQLFVVRVRTEAGTYVKEWAHGDMGRTRPALADALRARADILALDVCQVQLTWPPDSSIADDIRD